jgi:hypothetical protein
MHPLFIFNLNTISFCPFICSPYSYTHKLGEFYGYQRRNLFCERERKNTKIISKHAGLYTGKTGGLGPEFDELSGEERVATSLSKQPSQVIKKGGGSR